ncbi:hypothetical protein M3Y98_00680600 [Aphelenchoides besseyi]|nr:hypothetical protein M3Y98_00680600 [Aphelenchoides besseyi]KAI6209093.1 hypothetical protein M3Y96_00184400 [Aphelenchoides besseyi]
MSVKCVILNGNQRDDSAAQQVWSKVAVRFVNTCRYPIRFIRSNSCLILLFIGFVLMFGSVAHFAKYKRNNLKVALPIFDSEFTVTNGTNGSLTSSLNSNLCDCNGDNFCFKGLDEVGNVRLGLPFDCSFYENLNFLQLLDSDAAKVKPDYEQIVADDTWSPVFVTSISSDYFTELKAFVKNIRDYYPKSKIVVFDIGLETQEIKELSSWCLVEYRVFDFSKYPTHVQNLKNYSFKLTIIEAFEKYKTFFYVDPSVRIDSRRLVTFLQGVQSGVLLPFTTHTWTGHSVYATTHPAMYAYFPLPIILTQIEEVQATFQFITDSAYTRHIFKWWYLCAMTENCIDPPGAELYCNFNGRHSPPRRIYANCHRFDQAMWNLATLAYLFGAERGAVHLNYTKNWLKLNENLIVEVERNRKKAMEKFVKLLDVRRGEGIYDELKMQC